jgi:hypothetical protein
MALITSLKLEAAFVQEYGIPVRPSSTEPSAGSAITHSWSTAASDNINILWITSDITTNVNRANTADRTRPVLIVPYFPLSIHLTCVFRLENSRFIRFSNLRTSVVRCPHKGLTQRFRESVLGLVCGWRALVCYD